MPLSGLDIYKLLPKTNCKDCGYATCLAFAMALAQKKISLEKCPHVSQQAREALESASRPPIHLITIGTGEAAISIGNETVMYRHEEKFHHPPAVGIYISDSDSDNAIALRLKEIREMSYGRVGKNLHPHLIYIDNTSRDAVRFSSVIATVNGLGLPLALCALDAGSIRAGIEKTRGLRPLVVIGAGGDIDALLQAIDDKTLPVALPAVDLDQAQQVVEKAKSLGHDEIVIRLTGPGIARRVEDLTYMRRAALKKNFRAFGYPALIVTGEDDPMQELAEAVTYMCKYAGVVVTKYLMKEHLYPLLVAREDIYADPQKPVQVEPKIYEVGKVGPLSPVIVTTNFSITYFTVAGEVESSKVPTYIICCEADGMSVLTAWAAEKFTAESITGMIKKCGIEDIVRHRKIIIPGYVSVLSGKLEDVSKWTVNVGPREASGIPVYLRSWRA